MTLLPAYFQSCLRNNHARLRFLFCIGGLLLTLKMQSQNCPGDNVPPTAVCHPDLTVSLQNNWLATLAASAVDGGSSDNNSIAALEISRFSAPGCGVPNDFAAQATFCCADIGQNVIVALKVRDCNNNEQQCLSTVRVTLSPTCQAPPDVTVSCGWYSPDLSVYGDVNGASVTTDYALFDTVCNKGTIVRNFSGNICPGTISACTQRIVVEGNQGLYVRFPHDLVLDRFPATYELFGRPEVYQGYCSNEVLTYEDTLIQNVPAGFCGRIDRTWTFKNPCWFNPALAPIVVPNPNPSATPAHPANLPGARVAAPGDTTTGWFSTIARINNTDPAPTDFSTFYAADGVVYVYTQQIWITEAACPLTSGQAYFDQNANCQRDATEPVLPNWPIQIRSLATGRIYTCTTNASGTYSCPVSTLDSLIEVQSGAALFNACTPSTIFVNLAGEVPVQLKQGCNLLTVDMATSFLSICAANQYQIVARNLSAQAVPNTSVEVTLDALFDVTATSIPGTALGGNRWSFPLGTLQPGESLRFGIDFTIDCAAIPGQSHVSSAYILPQDPNCVAAANWSGADLRAEALCKGDSVVLRVRNVGTGDMTQDQEFVVVEDVIMFRTGTFHLKAGEMRSWQYLAKGGTWAIQTRQERTHPWQGMLAAAIEGCAGRTTTGLLSSFPLNAPNPFETTDCQENRDTVGFNTLEAFPKGMTDKHYIESGTDIEYLIRFQNTGTDTAFQVVVRTELPAALDPLSVIPGVSSHPYTFALQGNLLTFRFANIALPGNGVNQLGAQGFVKFRVSQQPNLPVGARIEQTADIHFDTRNPVATPIFTHLIGRPPVSSVRPDADAAMDVLASPNPSEGDVWLSWKIPVQGNLILTDALGRAVRREVLSGQQHRLLRQGLLPGLYYYRFETTNGRTAYGKIVLY